MAKGKTYNFFIYTFYPFVICKNMKIKQGNAIKFLNR